MAKVRVQLVARLQEHIGREPQGAIPPTTSGAGRFSGQGCLSCLAQQVFAVRVRQVLVDAWRDHGVFPSVSAHLMRQHQLERS
jgi:hypothetical protein